MTHTKYSLIKKILCKLGFHSEKDLCLEVDTSYLLDTKTLILKCNACNKVFQKHRLEYGVRFI